MAFTGLGDFPLSAEIAKDIPKISAWQMYYGRAGKEPAPQKIFTESAAAGRSVALWGLAGGGTLRVPRVFQPIVQRKRKGLPVLFSQSGGKPIVKKPGQVRVDLTMSKGYIPDAIHPSVFNYAQGNFQASEPLPIKKVAEFTRKASVIQNAIQTQAERAKRADNWYDSRRLLVNVRRLGITKKRYDDVRKFWLRKVAADPRLTSTLIEDHDIQEKVWVDPAYKPFRPLVWRGAYVDPYRDRY